MFLESLPCRAARVCHLQSTFLKSRCTDGSLKEKQNPNQSSKEPWGPVVSGPQAAVFFYFFNWRITTLQYCDGFCHTSIWIGHGDTCVSPHPEPPSHLPPHPMAPDGHRAWVLGALRHASNSHRLSVLQMVACMFQGYSLTSSHPRLLPLSPRVCSLRLRLLYCQAAVLNAASSLSWTWWLHTCVRQKTRLFFLQAPRASPRQGEPLVPFRHQLVPSGHSQGAPGWEQERNSSAWWRSQDIFLSSGMAGLARLASALPAYKEATRKEANEQQPGTEGL